MSDSPSRPRGRLIPPRSDDPVDALLDELLAERQRREESDGEAPGPRCAACRVPLIEGQLASACARCEALHHLPCYAERRGCAVRGCGGSRAAAVRVGSAPAQDLPLLQCGRCGDRLPWEAVVARCACGRTLHTDCYALLEHCGEASCRRPVALLRHGDALALHLRRRGRLLGVAAGVGLGLLTALVVARLLLAARLPAPGLETFLPGLLLLGGSLLLLGLAGRATLGAHSLPSAIGSGEASAGAESAPGEAPDGRSLNAPLGPGPRRAAGE